MAILMNNFLNLLVCFKRFEDENEFFKICSECIRRVCEDCSASYGKDGDNENKVCFQRINYIRR